MKACAYFFCMYVLLIFIGTCAESPFQPYWPRPRYQAQSFLFTRPLGMNIIMQQALWHNIVYEKAEGLLSGFQVAALYQQATSYTKNRYYFLLDCHSNLLVSGDDNINDRYCRNIRAEWLQLPSNFKGNMAVDPKQIAYGFFIEYHQDFTNLFDIGFIKDYWLSLALPVVSVCNDMRLKQWNVQNPGTCPADIVASFCNPSWEFSKICGPRKIVRPADLYLRFGKVYYNKNNFQLIYYTGFTVPVVQGQDPAYLFYPIPGNNGHFGTIAGFQAQILLSDDDIAYAISFFAALESVFLIRNNQVRTFDLRCKPLSRYMLFVRHHGLPDEYIPGVNVLSRRVRVHPYFLADFACGWRFKTEFMEFEIGYGIWGHGDEKIELKCEQCCQGGFDDTYNKKCPENAQYGIAGNAPAGYHESVTASESTICNQAPYDRDDNGDPVFVPITGADLNLLSGASRSAFNNKIFASLGLQRKFSLATFIGGAGLYVEIPQFRTALQSIGMWVKAGATF